MTAITKKVANPSNHLAARAIARREFQINPSPVPQPSGCGTNSKVSEVDGFWQRVRAAEAVAVDDGRGAFDAVPWRASPISR